MEDGMEDGIITVFVLLLAGLCVAGGCAAGRSEGRNQLRNEAAAAGHAHYRIINTTNGTTQFTWNPSCTKTN